MNTPLVSFIVPCYNYARFLPDCLNSIFAQEGDYDFEVIVIDDASTDNTLDVIGSYVDPRIHVFRHEVNRGHARTINEGLLATRGEFVARIDPDDRYRHNYLTRVLPKFKEFPEVGLVYGDPALMDESGRITVEQSPGIYGTKNFKGNELISLLARNHICAPTVIARRHAWLAVPPVPEWLAFNDWYFTMHMARRFEFCYLSEVLADYRVHANNHHGKIIAGGIEEQSIMWLLDKVFSEQEKDPELEAEKRRHRKDIYAAQFLILANKYFALGMYADARRCYARAMRSQPRNILRADVLRHFSATLIGRSAYEGFKRLLRPVGNPKKAVG